MSQPVRVAGVYVLVSLLWITTSDWVVARVAPSADAQLFLNTTKGWFFVAVTTALLYGILERDRRSVAAETARRVDAERRARRVGEFYQALGETGEALLGLAEGRDILPEACRIAVEGAGLRMAWVGIVDPDSALVRPVASAGHVDGFFDGLEVSVADVPSGQGPTGLAVRTGRTVTCNDLEHDPSVAALRDRTVPRGYLSSASAPLRRHGEVVGAFVAYASEARYFTPEVVEVFERIAGAVSFGLEFQRREAERQDAYVRLEQYGAELQERVAERTQELRELADRLAEADRAKSRFLANMSHELRTPLNSIIGFTGVLLQGMTGELSAEQRIQLEMVRGSGRYLLSLVNDVLDLSRIEAGRSRVDAGPVALIPLVREAVEIIRPLAEEKSLELDVRLPESAEEVVTDRAKLQQILLNLLANAVKFTESGRVSVTIRQVGMSALVVSVEDTGSGIAADELESVFEEFYQVERADGDKSRGSGLGLTITKRLADMIGAKLLVRSVQGEGSVFEVVIPARVPDEGR